MGRRAQAGTLAAGGGVFRLAIESPFDGAAAIRHLAFRAIAGVEAGVEGAYLRTVAGGAVRVSEEGDGLRVEIWGEGTQDAEDRLRSLFGLDADPRAIGAHLSVDPSMTPLVAARPALRVPGGWDPFESALRAVLGQQVSVTAARLLAGRLVERAGEEVADAPFPGLTHRFPTPERVIAADLSAMGMPGARVATLRAIAAALIEDPLLFRREASVEETVARLRTIKGIGEWTAQVIAMRACREPDAFPADDVGLQRGAADADGVRPSATALLRRAEAWRPYRAYAAYHLWAHDAARSSVTPPFAAAATD